MKAGLATSLSIACVLATGGAALVLNSSILDTESAAKGSPALATVVGLETQSGIMPLGDGAAPRSAAELSASGVADVIGGDQSPLEATVADSPPSMAPASIPTTTVTMPTSTPPATEKQFKVGDAAMITLTVSDTKLLVKDIAITPGSGYKVTNQVSRDGDDVRITLASPTRMIEFSARLVNGQIMAAIGSPSSGNLTPQHHDDDDERDDEDEHNERERERGDEHHEREHDNDDD